MVMTTRRSSERRPSSGAGRPSAPARGRSRTRAPASETEDTNDNGHNSAGAGGGATGRPRSRSRNRTPSTQGRGRSNARSPPPPEEEREEEAPSGARGDGGVSDPEGSGGGGASDAEGSGYDGSEGFGGASLGFEQEGESAPFNLGEPKSWETLVDEASFPSASVALALVKKFQSMGWNNRLRPFHEVLMVPQRIQGSWGADFKLWVRQQSEALPPKYYLAVIQGEVKAVYGLKACYLLDKSGQRYAALSGERSSVSGHMIYPELVGLFSESIKNQYQYLHPMKVAAPEEEALTAALEADSSVTLVDPVVGGPEITAWPLLQIHPSLAIFFLNGLPLREAYRMILILKKAVGDNHLSSLKPLLDLAQWCTIGGRPDARTQYPRVRALWNHTLWILHLWILCLWILPSRNPFLSAVLNSHSLVDLSIE